MWEDGYSNFPVAALGLITGLNNSVLDGTPADREGRLKALCSKLSYQMYNYGEGYVSAFVWTFALHFGHAWRHAFGKAAVFQRPLFSPRG